MIEVGIYKETGHLKITLYYHCGLFFLLVGNSAIVSFTTRAKLQPINILPTYSIIAIGATVCMQPYKKQTHVIEVQ